MEQSRTQLHEMQALVAKREQEHTRAIEECRLTVIRGAEFTQAIEGEKARIRDECRVDAKRLEEKYVPAACNLGFVIVAITRT